NADSEFACQSDPRSDCVLPVTGPDADVFSHFHVYYHGAGAETRYQGTFSLGFLRGASENHTSSVNITVKENESITNQSVPGIVTSTPGTYAATFSLTATVTDTAKKVPIQMTVPVAVK